jgi:DNA-binding MarR family transcriptional regulator
MVFKKGNELSFPQTMLLIELHRSGASSMGELSQRLHITQGVTTRMVDRLVEKGLVERNRDKVDRRIVHVSPTKRGARLACEIESINREKMKELFLGVPERKRTELLGFLKDMEQKFEREEVPEFDRDEK